jgi:hypothetical protein
MILYRLTSAKPHYPTKRLMEEADRHDYLAEKISQNSRISQ